MTHARKLLHGMASRLTILIVEGNVQGCGRDAESSESSLEIQEVNRSVMEFQGSWGDCVLDRTGKHVCSKNE